MLVEAAVQWETFKAPINKLIHVFPDPSIVDAWPGMATVRQITTSFMIGLFFSIDLIVRLSLGHIHTFEQL